MYAPDDDDTHFKSIFFFSYIHNEIVIDFTDIYLLLTKRVRFISILLQKTGFFSLPKKWKLKTFFLFLLQIFSISLIFFITKKLYKFKQNITFKYISINQNFFFKSLTIMIINKTPSGKNNEKLVFFFLSIL